MKTYVYHYWGHYGNFDYGNRREIDGVVVTKIKIVNMQTYDLVVARIKNMHKQESVQIKNIALLSENSDRKSKFGKVRM
jgi:hypothetical protein